MLTMMMIDSSEGCDIQIQILFSITNLKDAPDERRQECGCHIPYAICHGSGSCSGDIDDDRQPGKHTHTHAHTNKQQQPTQLYKYYTSIRNASSITKDISSRHSNLGMNPIGDLQCVLYKQTIV